MVVPGNKMAVTVHGPRFFSPALPTNTAYASSRQQADSIVNQACHTDCQSVVNKKVTESRILQGFSNVTILK